MRELIRKGYETAVKLMKEFMYLQPFMKTYRFNMIKLPGLMVRHKLIFSYLF